MSSREQFHLLAAMGAPCAESCPHAVCARRRQCIDALDLIDQLALALELTEAELAKCPPPSPDPQEWATVDRCLDWLSDWTTALVVLDIDPDLPLDPRPRFYRVALIGPDNFGYWSGPTLHAALIAACQGAS